MLGLSVALFHKHVFILCYFCTVSVLCCSVILSYTEDQALVQDRLHFSNTHIAMLMTVASFIL